MVVKNTSMGIYGIPGTFPTGQVQSAINNFYDPENEFDNQYLIPRDKINTIYLEYKELILNKGFNKYGDSKSTELVEAIGANSGYDLKDVRTILLFIKNMAESGEINNEYYTIEKPPTGTAAVITKPFNFLGDTAKKFKWVAIAGIAGVGLYFAWPYLVKGRKKTISRRRK